LAVLFFIDIKGVKNNKKKKKKKKKKKMVSGR
jgi:hypothetical protein